MSRAWSWVRAHWLWFLGAVVAVAALLIGRRRPLPQFVEPTPERDRLRAERRANVLVAQGRVRRAKVRLKTAKRQVQDVDKMPLPEVERELKRGLERRIGRRRVGRTLLALLALLHAAPARADEVCLSEEQAREALRVVRNYDAMEDATDSLLVAVARFEEAEQAAIEVDAEAAKRERGLQAQLQSMSAENVTLKAGRKWKIGLSVGGVVVAFVAGAGVARWVSR